MKIKISDIIDIGDFIIMAVIIILIAFLFSSLIGCSNEPILEKIRDPDLSLGCVMVDGGAGFDSYFDTTKGKFVVCKLKCSKDLPNCYSFEYENTMTRCKGKVVTPCNNKTGDIINE